MRNAMIVFLVVITAGPACAAQPTLPDFKGTVDASTPTMIDKARHAAENDDYHPTAIEFVQDGNVFLTATRDHQVYEITLTRSGKLFASIGTPEPAKGAAG